MLPVGFNVNLGTLDRASYLDGSGQCFKENLDFLFYMWTDPLIQPFILKMLITALSFVHNQKEHGDVDGLRTEQTIVENGRCAMEVKNEGVSTDSGVVYGDLTAVVRLSLTHPLLTN